MPFTTTGGPMTEQARVAFLADKVSQGHLTLNQYRNELSTVPGLETDANLKNQYAGPRLGAGAGNDAKYLNLGRKAIEERIREIALARGVKLGQVGDMAVQTGPAKFRVGNNQQASSGLVTLNNAYNQALARGQQRGNKHVWKSIDRGTENNVARSVNNLQHDTWLK